jgi:hypothetical protein
MTAANPPAPASTSDYIRSITAINVAHAMCRVRACAAGGRQSPRPLRTHRDAGDYICSGVMVSRQDFRHSVFDMWVFESHSASHSV